LQARSRRNHFTSIAIKLLAASHFLFAGLALGVVLPIAANIFLVFPGFIVILGHFAKSSAKPAPFCAVPTPA